MPEQNQGLGCMAGSFCVQGCRAGPLAETTLEKCAGHILVRRAYAAINASDINYTAGRYAEDVGVAQL